MINVKYATHKRPVFFDLAGAYITPESKVLDIGAGKGDFSDHFNRTDFYLFEGNPETAAILRTRHPNTTEGLLPRLPYDDGFFDVIHCSHVVEHLQHQLFYDSLTEMDRCLKKGGVIIISAPLDWEGFFDDLSHVRPYPPSVYVRYMCDTEIHSRTRQAISSAYKIDKLVYRYKKRDILSGFVNEKKSFAVKVALWALRKLQKHGLACYDKTGYTIVLKKGE